MKRLLITILIISLLVIAICGCDKKSAKEGISIDRITFDDSESITEGDLSRLDSSSHEDASEPAASSSEDSASVEPKKFTVADVEDINEIPFLYVGNFVKLDSFESRTVGATKALIVDQNIETLTVKRGDYAYTNSKSKSALVDTEHTAYFHRANVLYKDKNDSDFKTAEINDYLSEYGVYPVGRAIEGFVVTEETVLSVQKNEEKENSFVITIDGEKAGAANKLQMIKYGGLSSAPVFKSVTIILTMTEDFLPVTVELTSVYTVNYFFNVECTQNYTVTFSNVNGEVSIPEEENLERI